MFLFFFQDVMIDLYKRNIWNDAKTVNVITTACFSKVTKVCSRCQRFFFLGLWVGAGLGGAWRGGAEGGKDKLSTRMVKYR